MRRLHPLNREYGLAHDDGGAWSCTVGEAVGMEPSSSRITLKFPNTLICRTCAANAYGLTCFAYQARKWVPGLTLDGRRSPEDPPLRRSEINDWLACRATTPQAASKHDTIAR